MAVEVASLEARFTANTTGFQAGLNSVNSGMNAASRSISSQLDSIGAGFTSAGTKMVALGGVMTGALGGAVWTAINFNEAMTNAGAILGKTQDEMADLNREVRGIGAASRFGPQMAAEAFYDIVSGVQDASTHMDILNAAIATAEGGSADLGATTSALIAVMNSYGFSADQAAFASDVMTRTVGMGVLTMDQLAGAIPQVTGMANSMGIEFDTLSGMLAFMTTKGISASQSATMLNSAMSTLLNPTAGLSDAISNLGYESGEAMVAALGLDGAYAAIREYGGGSFAGLITGQEALRAGLILTDASAGEFFENFKNGVDGATESARAIQMESVAAQWDVLKSSIQELAIVIGSAFLPAISDILGYINPIIPKITEWVEAHPDLIRYLGIAAVSITVFGGALIGLGMAFSMASSGLSAISSGLGIVKAALTGALGPFGLLILAGGALYAAWETNFGGIRDILTNFIAVAKQVLSGGLPSVLAAIDKYGPQMLQAIVDGLGDIAAWGQQHLIDPIVDFITGGDGDVSGAVGDWSTSILAAVEDIVSTAAFELGRLPGRAGALLAKYLPDIIAGVIDYGPQILAKIAETLGDITLWIATNVILPMFNGLVAGAQDIISAVSTYGDDIKGELARGIGDMAQWVFDNIITPIAQRLASLGFDASQAVVNFGSELLGALLSSVGDIVTWVRVNIVDPVVGEIQRIGNAVQEAIDSVVSIPQVMAGNADQAGDIVSGFVQDPGGMIGAIGASLGIGRRNMPSGAQGRTLAAGADSYSQMPVHMIRDPTNRGVTSAALVSTPTRGGSASTAPVYIENAYFQTSNLEQLWDELMKVANNRGTKIPTYMLGYSK